MYKFHPLNRTPNPLRLLLLLLLFPNTFMQTNMASNEEILHQLGDETKLWSPSKKDETSPTDVLANKVVMLYFSAHWCGPCRRFTPVLKDLYQKLKARENVEDFELVFCSMDKTDAEYTSYTSDMPWYCLPHTSPIMGKLANQYGAAGIPHLVVLDKDGTVLQQDGVGEVSIDPEGTNFPWRPKPLVDLLPKEYLTTDNKRRPMSELDDKYLMLYMSAHWCPPCKRFTPQLSKAYTALKKSRDDFELLFVSSDHDQQEFHEYFSEMTFCAMPYEEREAKADISKRLQIKGIPSLLIFGPRTAGSNDRPLINANVRGTIETGDYISEFPYKPKPYGDLNKSTVDINTCKCVIVFHEAGDDEEHEDIQETLQMVAENYTGRDGVKFYWATSPTGLSKTVREALKLGPVRDKPLMIFLDITDQGAYYVSGVTDITMEAVSDFVKSPGDRRQL